MSASDYPFAAIAGQPDLRLALLLACADWRLSVLLKGDKGSGKSTAARGLPGILPHDAPFVNLPIGVTEDRLLGGISLDDALQGRASFRHGLIAKAHGGVLYIDEVNLLADSLTDALLDVVSNGRHYIERDGFSAPVEARFILLGSMNIEEGALRPQLLDRFALSLDVEAPSDAEDRARIVESRLMFDADPVSFCAAVAEEQARLRDAVTSARAILPQVRTSTALLRDISSMVTGAGIRSLRADLAVLRASAAHAALDGRRENSTEDVEAVLRFALHHRRSCDANAPPPPPNTTRPETKSDPSPAKDDAVDGHAETEERIFPVDRREAPELRLKARIPAEDAISRRGSAPVSSEANRVNVLGSFTQSFRNTGTASLVREHLVFRTPREESGVRFLFVIDASGSQGAHQRMRAVKGAVAGLLETSVHRHDEVAVISFRGAEAKVVLEPCRDAAAALQALEFLPTGGRTPLAHALHLAATLTASTSPAASTTILILLTDGRANVPLRSADPWLDALEEARKLKCASVLVNTSADAVSDAVSTAPMAALAESLGAKLIRLGDLDREMLLKLASPG